MKWFDLFFPLAMLAMPIVFVLFSRKGPKDVVPEESRDRARGLTIVLSVSTLVLMTVHFLLWNAGFGFARFMFIGFFPLWFGMAMPAIAARNPDFMYAHPIGIAKRRASLAPRDHSPLAPRWLWTLSFVIAALFLLAIALRPWGEAILGALGAPQPAPFDDAMRRSWMIWLLAFVAVTLFNFGVLAMSLGMMRREPEPMDSRGSAELVAAYASLRRFKASGALWLFGVCGTMLYGGALIALSWMDKDSRSLVWLLSIGGGVAGSLIGIAGGVFGTLASLRRARITQMIRSLEAQRAPAP